ncbi:MAG: hypothetical protein HY898_26945 [Deltaproteobacteria bacterium]|nr:hypothetical protein [Deltaproteobacteria bacterium]
MAQPCLLVGLFAAASCQSSNHDALVAHPDPPDSGGSGGSGGFVVDGAAGGDSTTEEPDAWLDAPADDAEDSPEDTGVQPDGPSRLTIVNGLADAGAIRICFHAGTGGALSALPVPPSPEDATGLVFAHAHVFEALPGGVDVATQDVRPVVYAGDMSALGGKSCDALSPLPTGVVEAKLQVVPAGSLNVGRSVLLVVAGCAGGIGHEGTGAEQACGKGYAADKPNATLLVATMTRAPDPDRIGLQAFGGSVAAQSLSLRYTTSEQLATELAQDVVAGEIAPKPPTTTLTLQTLGFKPAEGKLDVIEKQQTAVAASTTLAEALGRGGLSMGDFVNGRNYTLVWVGAREGTGPGAWWLPFTMTLVRSDP